jgi:hypothetical protein
MNQEFFKIQLIDCLNVVPLGIFEYVDIPKVGEWLLTPDNDGSGQSIWIVESVIHFPKYQNTGESPHVVLHVSPSTREVEQSLVTMNINQRLDKRILKISK